MKSDKESEVITLHKGQDGVYALPEAKPEKLKRPLSLKFGTKRIKPFDIS